MRSSSERWIKYGIPSFAGALMFLGLVLNMFSPSISGNSMLDFENLDSEDLDSLRDGVNQNLERVPKFLKTMFGNERLNIHIDDNGTVREYAAVTEKGYITELKEGSLESPTMDVWFSAATIEAVSISEEPVKRLREALKSGEIKYQTHAAKTKIRMGLARLAFSVYGLFGG